MRSRHIHFDSVPNFRDLGGYRTHDGRIVAWGCLFRSAALHKMNERDTARLKGTRQSLTNIPLHRRQGQNRRPGRHGPAAMSIVDEDDALCIFTFPVVLGGGKKLFADGSARSYALTRSRVSSTGVMIARYERGGEIKIVDAALAEPSQAEAARQERMNREG